MTHAKKKTRHAPSKGDTTIKRAARKFSDEYGDVALALEIMRNTKLARPQPRYRSGRLTYRSL